MSYKPRTLRAYTKAGKLDNVADLVGLAAPHGRKVL
jgi:hypothetical protein